MNFLKENGGLKFEFVTEEYFWFVGMRIERGLSFGLYISSFLPSSSSLEPCTQSKLPISNGECKHSQIGCTYSIYSSLFIYNKATTRARRVLLTNDMLRVSVCQHSKPQIMTVHWAAETSATQKHLRFVVRQ